MRRTGFSFLQDLSKPCALRAPTVISVRIESIRTEITVMGKNRESIGFYSRSSIACGWLHHPHAIDDPHGRIHRPCKVLPSRFATVSKGPTPAADLASFHPPHHQ